MERQPVNAGGPAVVVDDTVTAQAGSGALTSPGQFFTAEDGAQSILQQVQQVFTPEQVADRIGTQLKRTPDLKALKVIRTTQGEVVIYAVEGDRKRLLRLAATVAEAYRTVAVTRTQWVMPNTWRDLDAKSAYLMAQPQGNTESDAARFHKQVLSKAVNLNASDIHIVMAAGWGNVLYRVNTELVVLEEYRDARDIAIIKLMCGYIYQSRQKDTTRGEWDTDSERNCTDVITLDNTPTKWRMHSFPNEDRNHAHVVLRQIRMREQRAFNDFSHWEGFDKAAYIASLQVLGYLDHQCEQIFRMFTAPSGGIFVAGKTCSGKTRLLDTAISGANALTDFQRLTICVEDEPELDIPRAIRTPVYLENEGESSVAFSRAMRSALRRNADILVIGEIRGEGSGQAVMRAILTDHLVPASLHVLDLPSIFDRLEDKDIGVPRSFMARPRRCAGLIWQRLLPTLCEHCRQPLDQQSALAQRLKARRPQLDLAGVYTRHPTGCDECHGIAPGMTVAAEIMDAPDKAMRQAIQAGDDDRLVELWHQRAEKRGDPTVRAIDHALEHVAAGRVCPQAVERLLQPLDREADE